MRWRAPSLVLVCGLASGCLVSFDGYRGGLEAGGTAGEGAGAGDASGGKAAGGKGSGGKTSAGSGGDAGETTGEGGDSAGSGGGEPGGNAGSPPGGSESGGTAGSSGSGGGGSGGGGSGGSAGSPPKTCPVNLQGPALVEVPTSDGGLFCMDRTEVPNEDYAVFLATDPATTNQGPACGWNNSYQPDTSNACASALGAYDPVARPRVPVSCIDWCDAKRYCEWAGKRLCGKIDGGTNPPGDYIDADASQWFRACSRGGTRQFPYGDIYQASYCNGVDSPYIHPASVATSANCHGGYTGLFDMSGNVAEWEDSCSANAAASDNCLIRGGTLQDAQTTVPSLLCNSSSLGDATPSSVAATRSTQDEFIGFRCCLDL